MKNVLVLSSSPRKGGNSDLDEGKIVNDVAAVGIAGILQGIGAMGGK